MTSLGKMFLGEEGRVFIDAQPFVMGKVRNLFKYARSEDKGEFTHKMISIGLTLDTAKDIDMLLYRYPLELAIELLDTIRNKVRQYDSLMRQVALMDNNTHHQPSANALTFALLLRGHQIAFNNMLKLKNKMLLADPIGQGKTGSAISMIAEARPALVILPPTLCTQWEHELHRFLPDITTHIAVGHKPYELPPVDVIITSYNRLKPWQDVLRAKEGYFKTVIMDEVHELRHLGTEKRDQAKALAKSAEYVAGLSGTPIVNYGDEIWSIIDVINDGGLGDRYDFLREWCDSSCVRDPHALHSFLVSQGLMMRRERIRTSVPDKQVITINADLKTVNESNDIAKLLALSVLKNEVGLSDDAARDFDWKMRHMTGMAKAKPTAQFVKDLVDQSEKVVLVGWHRDVYSLWLEELKHYNPVMYTGSETTAQKDASIKAFREGNAKVLIISLRSGAGIDGLQFASKTMVFGELDWSPQIMDQMVGRLEREGQTGQVTAYYITIEDGSDPYMIETLGLKRSQAEGVVEGKNAEAMLVGADGLRGDRLRDMAKKYLESIGETPEEAVPETGLFGETLQVLRRFSFPINSEEEMQRAVNQILVGNMPACFIEREFKYGKRGRLDFLVSNDTERVAVECKINSTKRAEVYRQVRRYAQEANITSLILLAPWSGVESFWVDGIKVVVVNFSKNAL